MPSFPWRALVITLSAVSATAQIRLPSLPLPVQPLQSPTRLLDAADSKTLNQLSGLRRVEIARLIRVSGRRVEIDSNGDPIVRGEILALSPNELTLTRAASLHLTVIREQDIASLKIHLTVFRTPDSLSTKKALREIRAADPEGSFDFNHIYLGSGAALQETPPSTSLSTAATELAGTPRLPATVKVGLLDTGIDSSHPVFRNSVIHTWGCEDHPQPAAHGTAVGSLLVGHAPGFRGVQPDADIYAADVYCGQTTGGAVDALVAALGWMVHEQIPVINISLVGGKNIMLERVIGALASDGFVIVAAVGNDGPAAAPLYPASYPHVVGVTAVDGHQRVLIEAARGPQVMFAAPGADFAAAGMHHDYVAVRGTSYAAPIVAGLLAGTIPSPHQSDVAAALDGLAKRAIDLGPPGRDLTYGYGLVGAEYPVNPATLLHR
jgi:subtilisin family serine protease